MTRSYEFAAALALGLAQSVALYAQTAYQPRVAPAPNEPDWNIVLRDQFGLSMFDDLRNPVKTSALAPPVLLRKAGRGPVKFPPVIALGLETRTRGGWYKP